MLDQPTGHHENAPQCVCISICKRGILLPNYMGADKSLAQPTSPCILFDGGNISFDASVVIYINSTNIPPIMIINWIYEN
jgi:hypothetical protein